MMKKISCYIICILLGAFALSCEDQWDKRVESEGDGTIISDLSVLEYIKANPDNAKFVALLERTGIDSILQQGMQYTVWLPPAESLVYIDTLSNDSLARRFAMNHINLNNTYAIAFKPDMRVKLISGKPVRMRADADSRTGYRLQNAGIEVSNLICKDGVIHELDTCLIPALNLYEKLENGDYTTLLEWLKRFDQSVFSPELSTPTDEFNELDEVIYSDSVYTTENEILMKGDLQDEDISLTIFATSDDVLEARMEQLINDFEELNEVSPTPEEKRRFEDWVIKSLIYNGEIENYGTPNDIRSVHNELWRCTKQEGVNIRPIECSNGLFYEVDTLHFPAFLMMDSIMNEVDDLMIDANTWKDELTLDVTNKGEDFETTSAMSLGVQRFTGKAGSDGDGQILEFVFSLSWYSFRVEDEVIISESVVPGEYEVVASYGKGKFSPQDIKVLVDDQEVGMLSVQKMANGDTKSTTLGIVTIPGDVVKSVEFKFEVVSPQVDYVNMAPIDIKLVPTDNNY